MGRSSTKKTQSTSTKQSRPRDNKATRPAREPLSIQHEQPSSIDSYHHAALAQPVVPSGHHAGQFAYDMATVPYLGNPNPPMMPAHMQTVQAQAVPNCHPPQSRSDPTMVCPCQNHHPFPYQQPSTRDLPSCQPAYVSQYTPYSTGAIHAALPAYHPPPSGHYQHVPIDQPVLTGYYYCMDGASSSPHTLVHASANVASHRRQSTASDSSFGADYVVPLSAFSSSSSSSSPADTRCLALHFQPSAGPMTSDTMGHVDARYNASQHVAEPWPLNGAQNTYSAPIVQDDRIPTHAQSEMDVDAISHKRDHRGAFGKRLAPKQAPVPDLRRQNEPESPNASSSRQSRAKVAIPFVHHEERDRSPRSFCDKCKEQPNGFGGQAELDRHTSAKHPDPAGPISRWTCHPDPAELEACIKCKHGRLYPREDNAASHLRRMHFNKRSTDGKKNQGRGGTSGGNDPPLQWLKDHKYLVAETVRTTDSFLHGKPPDKPRTRSKKGSGGDTNSEQRSRGARSSVSSPDEGHVFDVDDNGHAVADQTSYGHDGAVDANNVMAPEDHAMVSAWEGTADSDYTYGASVGFIPRYYLNNAYQDWDGDAAMEDVTSYPMLSEEMDGHLEAQMQSAPAFDDLTWALDMDYVQG